MRIFSFIFLSLMMSVSLIAQEIIWANKLLEYTDKYQFDNNRAEMCLGVTKLYPGNANEENVDPYSEGYVLYQSNSSKKNLIRVGFPGIVQARQVLLGGIFNIGSISSISIIDERGVEKEIYKLDQKPSKTKFNTFSTFFSSCKVKEVKILIDHTSINKWNLIKGIALSNSDQAIDLRPIILPQEGFKNKEKVAENISSKDCFEFNPKVSPDGKSLYFVKTCESQADQDIYYSELGPDGKWSEAKNIGFPLNNKGHNFVASISTDGRFLIVGNTYNEDGTEKGDGVSIAYKLPDGRFDVPKPINIPNFKNINDNANFFMSSDEKVLLMAIQDERSFGGLDLYASLYNKFNQTWSEPINLGKDINTPFSEDYPYLAADGKTLYFSSDGYMGYGRYDIFMSKRLDDTWTKWSKPINLGPMVNSKADDKGFTLASVGDQAYFNTVNFEEDSAHHMDIYKIDLPKILKQKPQVLLSGTIVDKNTRKPLRATLRIKDETGDIIAFCSSNDKTGSYVISVPFGKNYKARVDAINYFRLEDDLIFSDSTKGIDVNKDFEMRAYLDSGQTITFSNILFEKNSAKLTPSSYVVLDSLVDMLNQQIDSKIEIGGHTDNLPLNVTNTKSTKDAKNKNSSSTTGVAEFKDNNELSLARAKSVEKYLVEKGIKAERIQCKGYGASLPIADNKTEEGRAKNRRVVITYLSNIPR